jgi:A/G-specific adenine glycosylase
MERHSAQRNSAAITAPARRRLLARRLLAWFATSARDLPWRRTRDLYPIWLSEVMLQQTQVVTVIPFWERFLTRFPDIPALAAADERDVLRLWEGLGYYRRARQLHAAARRIMADYRGQFPTSFAELRSLPGIGRYTAGAVLSIGLDQRLPILEANTIRVLSRLTAYEGTPRSAAGQEFLWSVAEQILPERQCGAFNQALMELGSAICTPQTPACGQCPVAGLCRARQQQRVDQIPCAAKRPAYEKITEVAVVVRQRGRVLLRHCQPGERWAGLWDFPRFAAAAAGLDDVALARQVPPKLHELAGLEVAPAIRLATLKHGVTRFRITLHCYETRCTSPAAKIPGGSSLRWAPLNKLHDYPLSVTGRKLARLATQRRPAP